MRGRTSAEPARALVQPFADDACISQRPCRGLTCPPLWYAQAITDALDGCACECVRKPPQRSPSLHSTNASDLAPPPLLHQAWKTQRIGEMDATTAACVRSWREINPRMRQDVSDDERADVFRYLVVHRYGGWWADVDTVAKRPLATLRGDLVVGREPQDNADGFGVLQYFFGALPRHRFFSDFLLPLVASRVARRRDSRGLSTVLWATGPLAFTAAYKQYVRSTLPPGERERAPLSWDRHVLPTCALGAWCYDCEAHGFRPYLEHKFAGSWKSEAGWKAGECGELALRGVEEVGRAAASDASPGT
jgi:hypothetical protein